MASNRIRIPIAARTASADRSTAKDWVLTEALGKDPTDSYTKRKMREWNAYMQQLSPWEREGTLDCRALPMTDSRVMLTFRVTIQGRRPAQ